ncbi:MAG TPA: tRNA pseudouridine(55) synthase TruB [Candidatus Binataceae bacterium]
MDGIILVDKPAGISSAEVVRRVKARVKPARVGHLGTLDPFATGLLPILVGEGTKLAPFLEGGDREYAGLIQLGTETDTLDREGVVVRTAEVPALEAARLAELVARFSGEIEQTPPVYSAIKRGGVPLYRLARKGGEVAPPDSRRIEIKRLELAAAGADAIRFTALCSPGTYARSLARDIGVALGSAAHLAELRRLRNGTFAIENAMALEEVLAAIEAGGANLWLIGLREAIPALPEISIDSVRERSLRNGDARALTESVPASAALFKVISHDGRLIAVAEATSRVTASIVRIFSA